MKHLRLLLALIAASVCSVQGMWAERTAPVFPEPKTLVSGETYYMYNPGSDRFVYRNPSNSEAGANAYTEARSPIVVTNVEDNIYTFNFEGTSYYLYSSDSGVRFGGSTSSSYLNYRKFRVEPTDGGYTIQKNYDYNENYYVGNNAGNDYIYSNFTSGNIVWQFYDAAGAEAIIRYRAKKALYDALVSADDYSVSFAIEEYEALYANDNATNEELTAAANTINECLRWHDRLASGESEFPIYTQLTGNANWTINNNGYSSSNIKNGQGGLKATVEVDQDATLVYRFSRDYYWYDFGFDVYLDGEHYQNINGNEAYNNGNYGTGTRSQRFFVELTPGKHTIEWVATSRNKDNETYFYLYDIAAYKTPTITVNLTQAGSLGTEVLYNVDHIKDVRKLIVKGHMNSDDWEKVNMMTGLFELDLTETSVESLPRINPGSFFHKIALPSGLKFIENNALNGCYLEEITFPETLTSIGNNAFEKTRIKEALIPQSVTGIGTYAFAENQSLLKVTWPQQVATVPDHCFDKSSDINDFVLPEGITSIGKYAFCNNYFCNYQLPSTVTYIGEYAFQNADSITSLYIPDHCNIEWNAFEYCDRLAHVKIGEDVTFWWYNNNYYTFRNCWRLEEIEFPTTFHAITGRDMLSGCTALKKVVLKSPTLIGGEYYNKFFNGLSTNIQVYVPSYLVNAYKLDPYWYNYNIMGFSTADVTDWTIKGNLTFYSQDRFEGTPNIYIWDVGSWTVNGELAQNINDFHTWNVSRETSSYMSCTRMISNCNNVRINGKYQHGYYVHNKINYSPYRGRWHFISLPFDIKVSEITSDNGALIAVRYYDGANRAANGTGGNWKDYAPDAIIPAGTGFILQINKDASQLYFTALDNESKQNVVSNNIFVKALDANDSEQSSNKGWNLVGNPWLSYYNIHKLNFTAPITVYDGYNRKYTAYSVIDDDYAISPNEAFFVQCPDEVNSISFPVDGRQMTSVIESQNGARIEKASERKLIDVQLCSLDVEGTDTEETQCDKTRFVLNPEASMNYETTRDASKFLEDGTSCPQIYTIEQGELLAINERPMGDGTVQLGVIIPQDDTYTISAPRNGFRNITLVDNETGMETDLGNSNSYTFTASAGTYESRFMLRVGGVVVTAIDNNREIINNNGTVYNLNGQRIATPQKGLYVVNGKKVINK